MAAAMMSSKMVVPAAPTKASLQRPAARSASFSSRVVSNGCKVRQMQVWTPVNNKFFETFSYLPPMKDDEISRQVDYMVNNGYIPCLEFAEPDQAYTASHTCIRFGTGEPGYYDNRYWTMWKLPMFGCNDPSQVLTEIRNCEGTFPNAYIRLVAFDQVRQVQISGFLVHRPPGASEFAAPEKRSVSETNKPNSS